MDVGSGAHKCISYFSVARIKPYDSYTLDQGGFIQAYGPKEFYHYHDREHGAVGRQAWHWSSDWELNTHHIWLMTGSREGTQERHHSFRP